MNFGFFVTHLVTNFIHEKKNEFNYFRKLSFVYRTRKDTIAISETTGVGFFFSCYTVDDFLTKNSDNIFLLNAKTMCSV